LHLPVERWQFGYLGSESSRPRFPISHSVFRQAIRRLHFLFLFFDGGPRIGSRQDCKIISVSSDRYPHRARASTKPKPRQRRPAGAFPTSAKRPPSIRYRPPRLSRQRLPCPRWLARALAPRSDGDVPPLTDDKPKRQQEQAKTKQTPRSPRVAHIPGSLIWNKNGGGGPQVTEKLLAMRYDTVHCPAAACPRCTRAASQPTATHKHCGRVTL
jgi:hypothetical protein